MEAGPSGAEVHVLRCRMEAGPFLFSTPSRLAQEIASPSPIIQLIDETLHRCPTYPKSLKKIRKQRKEALIQLNAYRIKNKYRQLVNWLFYKHD